jgi:sugar phosphate isomerase/epimerase
MTFRIGVMTWLYSPQRYPIEDTITKLANEGVAIIGLDGARTQLDPRFLPSQDLLTRLHKLGKNLEVEYYQMHSCHGGSSGMTPNIYGQFCCAPVDIANTNEEERKFAVRATIKQVAYCSQIGCSRLTVHPGSGYEESSDLKNRLLRSYRKICQAAKKQGVEILIENVTGRVYCSKVDEILELIENIGTKNLGILIDTGHTALSKLDLSDEVRKAGSLLHGLHCHDNDGKKDLHRVPVPGKGVIDWNDLFEALFDVHYKGPFMIEVFGGDSTKGIPNRPDIPLRDIRKLPERFPILSF